MGLLEALEVYSVLGELKRGSDCWCDVGSGGPTPTGHSEACKNADKLYRKVSLDGMGGGWDAD